uniref:Ribonuclease H-like domain, reverse transcriptase, RNA-dependent DNA polymerase n=1 Tax=Tanacetum cinerariifolium TaxID=118510 RepID=A0A6L2LZP6_TANCI|nr:ribonuclease H-like domain, reverse transcriptase, RNA-dependent DNA polymerase [Tanacetum cinerariifolium]
MVRKFWNVYTHSKTTKLPRFRQEAFEATYEHFTIDVAGSRDAAISEITEMSFVSVDVEPSSLNSEEQCLGKDTNCSVFNAVFTGCEPSLLANEEGHELTKIPDIEDSKEDKDLLWINSGVVYKTHNGKSVSLKDDFIKSEMEAMDRALSSLNKETLGYNSTYGTGGYGSYGRIGSYNGSRLYGNSMYNRGGYGGGLYGSGGGMYGGGMYNSSYGGMGGIADGATRAKLLCTEYVELQTPISQSAAHALSVDAGTKSSKDKKHITMATTSKLDSTRKDKGKMIIVKPEITATLNLRPIHCNKTIEEVVYNKWTSKHVHTRQPLKYCCILMEKKARDINLVVHLETLAQEVKGRVKERGHVKFVSRVLPNKVGVKVTNLDLLGVIEDEQLFNELSDEDVIRVCLLISLELIFMGSCLILASGLIMLAVRLVLVRDVKFKEDEKWDWSKYLGENTNDEPEWTDFRIGNLEETNDHHNLENHPNEEVNDFPYNNDNGYDSPLADSPAETLHTPLTRTLTDIYENTKELLLAEDEPKNYKEASNDQKWIEAMKDELDSINMNNTWRLTSLPPGHKAIGLKWVFKTKRDADGRIIKHNARLVAKGYIQEHGIDFEEKQATVALSSCESEFIAVTAAATQALYLKRLLSRLTYSDEEKITILVDNKSAIALMKNPVFHERSKHIDTKYHFIRECVKRDDIQVEFVSGDYQKADILTKALLKIRFLTMRQLIGLKGLQGTACD